MSFEYDAALGHAGAIRLPGEVRCRKKQLALSQAGVEIVNHPSQLGTTMKRLLAMQSSSEQVCGNT